MDLLCYNYATVHRKEEHFNENGMHLSCPGEKLNSVHLVGRPEFELLDYRSTEVIFPMLSRGIQVIIVSYHALGVLLMRHIFTITLTGQRTSSYCMYTGCFQKPVNKKL